RQARTHAQRAAEDEDGDERVDEHAGRREERQAAQPDEERARGLEQPGEVDPLVAGGGVREGVARGDRARVEDQAAGHEVPPGARVLEQPAGPAPPPPAAPGGKRRGRPRSPTRPSCPTSRAPSGTGGGSPGARRTRRAAGCARAAPSRRSRLRRIVRWKVKVHTGPRSCARMPIAICQPAPGAPTIISAGTRTSSKKTSENSASPVICLKGRTVMPGLLMSTRSRLIPWCFGAAGSVRQRRKHQSATSA